MATVSSYLRPGSLDEALEALSSPGSVVIGGGTKVNASKDLEEITVVDLQLLGLDGVGISSHGLRVGATVVLQRLVDDPRVPPVIRESARREQPSTLRNMATIAGTIAGASQESELLASLLVYGAELTVLGPGGERRVGLARLLADPGQLSGSFITSVDLEVTGAAAAARSARTVADRAIVAAVARSDERTGPRLALSGVARYPVLVEASVGYLPAELEHLETPGDFRGSVEYRRSVAVVLAARVLEEVE